MGIKREKINDEYRYKGKYLKKLMALFSVFSLLLLLIIFSLYITVIRNFETQRTASYKSAVKTQSNYAFFNISIALNDLYTLQSADTVNQWISAETGSAQYYLYSSQLYQLVGKSISKLNSTGSDIFILPQTEERHSVITSGGTRSREWFTEHYPVSGNILAHFENDSRMFLVCDEGYEYIYVAIRGIYNHGNVIFISQLPYDKIFDDSDEISSFIISRAFSPVMDKSIDDTISPLIMENTETMISEAMEGETEINIQGMPELTIQDGNLTRMYFVSFDTSPSHTAQLIIFLGILFLMLLITEFLLSRFIIRKLYSPIREIMKNTSEVNEENGKSLDEFAVIRHMGQRLKEVSIELQELADESRKDKTQQQIRLLLAGSSPVNESDAAMYAVALFFVDGSVTEGYSYSLMSLQACAETSSYATCVTISPSMCAVIINIEEKDKENYLELLKKLTEGFNDEDDVRIAVSNIVTGKHNIYRAYRQALRILESRNLYPQTSILTSSLVDNNRSGSQLTFTSSTEQLIINEALKGSEKALMLFDEVIGENSKVIGERSRECQNLYILLAACIMKITQEASRKASLQNLPSVNWQDVLSQWNEKSSFSLLREILEKTVMQLYSSTSQSDEEIISKMKEYIHKNYKYDIMLIDLANKFNITPKYCSSLFSQLSNDTFKNYLNMYRIEMACMKIQANPQIKISDLATDVGFNSSTSFIRVFNKYKGTSPKAYADDIASRKDSSFS